MAKEHVECNTGQEVLHHKVDELYRLNIQTSEEIRRETKRERAISRHECFKLILNSERVKTYLFCVFNFTMRSLIALTDI